MINCKDFVPKKEKGGLFKSGSIEDFEVVIKEMTEWVNSSNVDVINIETVLLPNIHDPDEEGSQDTELWTGGESSSRWYQLIRVWYK